MGAPDRAAAIPDAAGDEPLIPALIDLLGAR
jgi:hypothetical protein